MTVEPFKRREGGLVISHIEITRRRRAEEEVDRDREELAHALRMTTLGDSPPPWRTSLTNRWPRSSATRRRLAACWSPRVPTPARSRPRCTTSRRTRGGRQT